VYDYKRVGDIETIEAIELSASNMALLLKLIEPNGQILETNGRLIDLITDPANAINN